jgi:hypothetical protein
MALLTFATVRVAGAWNATGHMVVAIIAHEQMNQATRAKANELLHAHPRFEAHFERMMPRYMSRRDDAQKAQWYFAHAGTWPDLVRSPGRTIDREDVSRFHREYWHYINMPIFLSDAERHKLEPGLRLYVNRVPPHDPDDTSMNIVQAFKNSSRIVGDPNAAPDRRAVHLCWLIHLAGDSHQPLHAGSLYTAHRFPRGDEGGNQLEVAHDWKLHSFWDSQIGTEDDFGTLRDLAANVVKNGNNSAIGQKAAANVNIDQWIDESNRYAKQFAYPDEVLEKVAAREQHLRLGPLDLSAA